MDRIELVKVTKLFLQVVDKLYQNKTITKEVYNNLTEEKINFLQKVS